MCIVAQLFFIISTVSTVEQHHSYQMGAHQKKKSRRLLHERPAALALVQRHTKKQKKLHRAENEMQESVETVNLLSK